MFSRPLVHATPCFGCRYGLRPAVTGPWKTNQCIAAQRYYDRGDASLPTHALLGDPPPPPEDTSSITTDPTNIPIHHETWRRAHGRIRRINGRMRRELYQPLGINSLGRRTEILMLNEVPEPRSHGSEMPPPQHVTEKVSAADIEAMLHGQEPSKPAEIFAAIREHRPDEDTISRDTFNAKVRGLADSFTQRQLSSFIRSELKVRARGERVDELKPKPPTDGMLDPVANIKVSPWRSNQSDAQPSADGGDKAKKPRGVASKVHASAEKVLRSVWRVQVEEEANAPGRTSIALTSEQWGLLQTKDAQNLFSVMRSGRFYRNTRLERSSQDNLRIVGPRAEAESIARLVESAFRGAQSIVLDLTALAPDRTLAIRESQNMRDIMLASKTHIAMTRQGQAVAIFAFNRAALDNALRRMLALLEATPKARALVTCIGTEDCAEVPMHIRSVLPSSARLGRLVRLIRPQTTTLEKDANVHLEPSGETRSRVNEALNCRSSTKATRVPRGNSYWRPTGDPTPWRASFGYLLHKSTGSTDGPGLVATSESGEVQQIRKEHGWSTFAPQPPNLAKVLPNFTSASGSLRDLQQLRVRLMPAPLPDPSAVKLRCDLPSIEMVFRFRPAGAEHGFDTGGASRVSESLGMHLHEMRAVQNEEIVDVSFAANSRDVRFKRRHLVFADTAAAIQDPSLADFIREIIKGAQSDSALHAPASVRIQAPTDSQQGQNNKPRMVEYLFAGFEHRHTRLFTPVPNGGVPMHLMDPGYVIKLSDVKTDASGASRSELAIECRDREQADTAGLVDSAFNLLQFFDAAHRREYA